MLRIRLGYTLVSFSISNFHAVSDLYRLFSFCLTATISLQDLEQKQQELDALTTRIQNLEDVSTVDGIDFYESTKVIFRGSSQREFCIFTSFFHLLHGSLVYLFSVNRRYLALQSSKRLVRQAIKLLL